MTNANVYLPLTGDEEFQSGLMCNGVKATPTRPASGSLPGE